MAGVAALGVAVGVPILLATRSTNPAHRTASEATCRDLAQLDQAEAHYQRVVRGGGTLLSAADFEELRALAAEIESAADRLDADVAPLARAGHSSVASRVAALAAEVHLQAGNLNSLINANPHDVSGARADLVAVLSCR